ncbi:MAG: hypothetical protein R2738_04230 [Bacteroides graminisolvens]
MRYHSGLNRDEKVNGCSETGKANELLLKLVKKKVSKPIVGLEKPHSQVAFDFMVRDAIGRKWQLGTIPG